MVSGVGVDLFEVERMARRLREGGPAFAAALFTPAEIARCSRRRAAARAFAACFAAKEAVAKALAWDGSAGLPWLEIEILEEEGRLVARLHGAVATRARERGVARLRLAHGGSAARVAATALAEREPGAGDSNEGGG
jgi:holo-[acyl-carrier protein] synthase